MNFHFQWRIIANLSGGSATSSRTKIVVLWTREIVCTAISVGLTILLVSLSLIMSRPKEDAVLSSVDANAYVPGVCTASLVLRSQSMNVEMAVDTDHINSVTLSPLSDSVATTYPSIQPVLEDLAKQVCATQSTENLFCSMGTRYISAALINAVKQAFHKAEIKDAQ